jgi:CheY-like chemotaxis protein
MKVLIVDDDAINRKVLRAVLGAVESKDGLTALQTLQHEKIDAVISDILSLILPQNRASGASQQDIQARTPQCELQTRQF